MTVASEALWAGAGDYHGLLRLTFEDLLWAALSGEALNVYSSVRAQSSWHQSGGLLEPQFFLSSSAGTAQIRHRIIIDHVGINLGLWMSHFIR